MIRCIAIDDEPLALQKIGGYIDKTPFLEKIALFESAFEAIERIQQEDIDLMFVDINMPDLNGMDFVKSLTNAPRVIFTTAYSEYAIEGYKVDAVDYLLKPIDYNDFLKAVEKARKRMGSEEQKAAVVESNEKFLFIKSEYKIVRINLSDILYVEGMREYLRIHIQNQPAVMALMSMKKMEEYLPGEQFMRVHRSFIVNLEKVTAIQRKRIIFGKDEYIPVSDQYKDAFQKFLDDNFLV